MIGQILMDNCIPFVTSVVVYCFWSSFEEFLTIRAVRSSRINYTWTRLIQCYLKYILFQVTRRAILGLLRCRSTGMLFYLFYTSRNNFGNNKLMAQ